MPEDAEKQLRELNNRVGEIHTALFGVEGAGGLHRWVRDINRQLATLEKEVTLQKGKMIGIAIGVSGFVSVAAFAASHLLSK